MEAIPGQGALRRENAVLPIGGMSKREKEETVFK